MNIDRILAAQEHASEAELQDQIKRCRQKLDQNENDEVAYRVLEGAERELSKRALQQGRRPDINYLQCGLKIGQRIELPALPDEVVT